MADVAGSTAWSSIIASAMPASSLPNVFADLGLSATNAALAAQMSQLFSQRDSLAAIAASYKPPIAVVEAVNALGLGARSSLVAAQAAQIVSAQDSLARIVATAGISASMVSLLDSITRYGQVQAHLGTFAVNVDAPVMLRGHTRLAGRRYDSYPNGLPARPIARRATVPRLGGDAQSSLLIAEALTAEVDDDEREDLTERFSVVSLEAWQTGPAAARLDLFAALDEMKPGLSDWLKAAWDDIERDGYKAASKIANSTVECIDHTLRELATVDEVATWIAGQGRPKPGWIDDKGKPTRRAKITYAMQGRSHRDTRLAAEQVDALAGLILTLMDNFQSVKHAEETTIVIMRNWVQTTEAAMSQLLLGR